MALDRAALESAGIDVEDALARLMGSEALLERLLGKFLDDASFAALEAAIDAHDVQAAIDASHTLKGVAGNLSLTRVYDASARMCDLFRAGNWDDACALMPMLADAYHDVQGAIRKA